MNKIVAYPVVFVIVVVVWSPGDEDEDHREDHKDDEDWAGVNIDRENCQASKVARYLKSIIRKSILNSVFLLVKTGIFASNMAGYTGCYASLVSCHHLLRNKWAGPTFACCFDPDCSALWCWLVTGLSLRSCSETLQWPAASLRPQLTGDQCQAWSAVIRCPAEMSQECPMVSRHLAPGHQHHWCCWFSNG